MGQCGSGEDKDEDSTDGKRCRRLEAGQVPGKGRKGKRSHQVGEYHAAPRDEEEDDDEVPVRGAHRRSLGLTNSLPQLNAKSNKRSQLTIQWTQKVPNYGPAIENVE
ncbi:hypothetical protein DIPPA_09981 [Diplonema papillatum]|nr:hypothetical protein DIPPA_09981 [Diplonema papillatum]